MLWSPYLKFAGKPVVRFTFPSSVSIDEIHYWHARTRARTHAHDPMHPRSLDTPRRAMLHQATPRCAAPSHAAPRCAAPCYLMLRHATSPHVTLAHIRTTNMESFGSDPGAVASVAAPATTFPTERPTNVPTQLPSSLPSPTPTDHPTPSPTLRPTDMPTTLPPTTTAEPSILPTLTPTHQEYELLLSYYRLYPGNRGMQGGLLGADKPASNTKAEVLRAFRTP